MLYGVLAPLLSRARALGLAASFLALLLMQFELQTKLMVDLSIFAKSAQLKFTQSAIIVQ